MAERDRAATRAHLRAEGVHGLWTATADSAKPVAMSLSLPSNVVMSPHAQTRRVGLHDLVDDDRALGDLHVPVLQRVTAAPIRVAGGSAEGRASAAPAVAEGRNGTRPSLGSQRFNARCASRIARARRRCDVCLRNCKGPLVCCTHIHADRSGYRTRHDRGGRARASCRVSPQAREAVSPGSRPGGRISRVRRGNPHDAQGIRGSVTQPGGTDSEVAPVLAMAKTASGNTNVRDPLIAAAVTQGHSVAEVALHLGLSRQQIHAVLDRESRSAAISPEMALATEETARALLGMTDHVRFEELVHVLLRDVEPTVRPLGGVGDRARDAVADLADGDGAIFSISLEREWTRKIRREIERMEEFGHRPPRVYGVTNRRITRDAQDRLEDFAQRRGITLLILGQQWLVATLLHPDYLDLRRRFLGLTPPRPKIFLTPPEYRRLLNGRPANLGLDVPLVGRQDDIDEVLRRLSRRGCLVLHGPGGVGKTRLLLEAADFDSGSRAWRFVDESIQVPPDALGELGGGDELVVVIDNAHRRRDLRAILGVLERRDPMPKVVFVVRPHRLDEIRSATAGLWLDVPDERDFLSLRPLARSLIADIVRGEPFEIGYAGMVSQIAALAEGNPLIAVLAATLARDGRSLPEITRDEVFAGHVAGLLSTLTHDDPERPPATRADGDRLPRWTASTPTTSAWLRRSPACSDSAYRRCVAGSQNSRTAGCWYRPTSPASDQARPAGGPCSPVVVLLAQMAACARVRDRGRCIRRQSSHGTVPCARSGSVR